MGGFSSVSLAWWLVLVIPITEKAPHISTGWKKLHHDQIGELDQYQLWTDLAQAHHQNIIIVMKLQLQLPPEFMSLYQSEAEADTDEP